MVKKNQDSGIQRVTCFQIGKFCNSLLNIASKVRRTQARRKVQNFSTNTPALTMLMNPTLTSGSVISSLVLIRQKSRNESIHLVVTSPPDTHRATGSVAGTSRPIRPKTVFTRPRYARASNSKAAPRYRQDRPRAHKSDLRWLPPL